MKRIRVIAWLMLLLCGFAAGLVVGAGFRVPGSGLVLTLSVIQLATSGGGLGFCIWAMDAAAK